MQVGAAQRRSEWSQASALIGPKVEVIRFSLIEASQGPGTADCEAGRSGEARDHWGDSTCTILDAHHHVLLGIQQRHGVFQPTEGDAVTTARLEVVDRAIVGPEIDRSAIRGPHNSNRDQARQDKPDSLHIDVLEFGSWFLPLPERSTPAQSAR